MTDTRCAICGKDELVEKHGTFEFEWPTDISAKPSRFADATWCACGACGEEVLPAELIARVEAERYRLDGLLSPAEVLAVRKRLGLTQRDMSKLLGVGEKSYTRWELGLSVQTKSMDNLVRLADQHPEVLAKIEAQRRPERRGEIAAYVANLAALKSVTAAPLAAHGGELDEATARHLHSRLRALAKAQAARG
jgi:HTH-type transcriptional regulator/antitoxin MqsA